MLLTEKYADKIQGVISCYDRVVIQGTIPNLCYSDGITSYMYMKKIRVFDYAKQFAEPLRDEIVKNAKQIAADNNIEIDYIRKKNFRKEAKIKEILQKRGNHPGLVHIFSALEPCTMYSPWHNKKTGKTYLQYKKDLI